MKISARRNLLKCHPYDLRMIIVRIRNRQRLACFIQMRIRNSRIYKAFINRRRLIYFFILTPRTFWLRGSPQGHFGAI